MTDVNDLRQGVGESCRRTRYPYPCLTPLYFAGISHHEPSSVYGNFTHQGYGVDMATAGELVTEELCNFHPDLTDDASLQSPFLSDKDFHRLDVLFEEEQLLLSKPEWQLAKRIAASKGLGKSELLPRFLLYVCRERLLGREREITEQRIGRQIFKRPSDYNPGEDNIVRSYARLLRKRLDAYFESEGLDEPMRITIPRGGYVPSFHNSPETSQQSAPQSLVIPQSPNLDPNAVRDLPFAPDSMPELLPAMAAGSDLQQTVSTTEAQPGDHATPQPFWRSAGFIGAAALAVGVFLTLAVWFGIQTVQTRRQLGPAHLLWEQMFSPDRNTLIVPADSGLGILENLTKRLVNVEEYASGSYLSDIQLPAGLDEGDFNDLRRQRYTSLVDLDITTRLTKLPEVVPTRTQVRYARSITADDIKNSNIILLGSKYSNPWVSLFEKKLNFKLEYTPYAGQSYVLNEHPAGTEEKVYRNTSSATPGPTYGVVAYLPEPDGTGHALVIEGLNMAATQAAADALFNPTIIEPVLRQAQLPDGSLQSFECLIETTSIGAAAPGAQIIATRIHPR
jgi:hypothetical protein